MDKKIELLKAYYKSNTMKKRKVYQPPKIRSVAFQIEAGFSASLTAGEFGLVGNSGNGFWGGTADGGVSSGQFGSHGFGWDSGTTGGEGSASTFSGYDWNW